MEVKKSEPKTIMDTYQQIHLDINIMYVNKVSYMTAICKYIKMINCIMMNDQDEHQVLDTVGMIIKRYSQRGFWVNSVSGNNIFNSLKDWLTKRHVEVETYDARACVTTIERSNHFLKERIECIRFNMPFTKLPCDFLIEVVL